jgi:chemotaxis response regulator CheB
MTGSEIFQSLGLGSVPAAIAMVIVILLQRKGANKKLQIEETGADTNQFDVITKKYQQIADNWQKTAETAQKATETALAELEKHKEDRETISGKLEETNTKLDQIRTLFKQVMKRSNIVLTPEEQEIFDSTTPSREIKTRVRSRGVSTA